MQQSGLICPLFDFYIYLMGTIANTPQLSLLLKGAQRRKPVARDKRLPITPLILEKIYSVLDTSVWSFEDQLLWAACCLGFFGFLRSGEFTVAVGDFDSSWHLSVDDIAVDSVKDPTMLQVKIKGSKTDQLRLGATIIVGKTGSNLCPVLSMMSFLKARGLAPGPLFCHKDYSPLTRSQLVNNLRQVLTQAGVDASNFTGHSFRIGAATAAAANGVEDSLIQTLGRWKSDSYKRYIRIPNTELANISAKLLE